MTEIISYKIVAKSRSTSGSNEIIENATTSGGSNIDVIKSSDSANAKDNNVYSALYVQKNFLPKDADGSTTGVIDYTAGIKLNGDSVSAIIKSTDSLDLSDTKVISAAKANNLFARKDIADTFAEDMTFNKGINVGGIMKAAAATIVGIATIGTINATTLNADTGTIPTLNATTCTVSQTLNAGAAQITADLAVGGKMTALNAVVNNLATTYQLSVSDTATILRTIVKDYISSDTYIPGFSGSGFKLWNDGGWNLELDTLTVRKVMNIFELIINKIRSVNGGLIVSPGNGKISSVSLANSVYTLGIEGDMTFVANDLIRCQTFRTTGSKYYWVQIQTVVDNNITVNQSDFGTAVPEVGDELVQMGNTTDTSRQGCLYLVANEDGKPRIEALNGINSTDLSGKAKAIFGDLDGITDTDFASISGYGLYAENVYLKGSFILKSGKTVETALSDTQTAAASDATNKANSAYSNAVSQAATNATNLYVTQTTYTTEVKVLTDSISAKVSQADFNSLGTRVSTAETSITANANSISAQATSINDLSGRMTTAEAKITSDAINLTVKSQVDTAKSAAQTYADTAINNGRLYLRGTGDNRCVNSLIQLNGNYITNECSRGLYLLVLNRSDLSTNYTAVYDILGTDSLQDTLATKLNSFDSSVIITLISFDWIAISHGTLISALENCGGSGVVISGDRIPYAFVGIPGIGKGAGIEVVTNNSSTAPYAEINTLIVNGIPQGIDTSKTVIDSNAQSYANTAYNNAKSYVDNNYVTQSTYSAEISVLNNSITSKVSQTDFNSLGTRVGNAESAISQNATAISSKVSSSDYTGATIASLINQSASTVKIAASKVELTGQVSFSMLDNSTQATINAKATQSDAQGYVNSLKNTLGNLAYQGAVSKAMLDNTIIDGAYIQTSLLDVKTIVANGIYANTINAGNATFSNIIMTSATVTGTINANAGTVGGFTINSNNLTSTLTSGLQNSTSTNLYLSANLIRFNTSDWKESVYIGEQVMSAASGLEASISITKDKVFNSAGYVANCGIIIDVQGAVIDDDYSYIGNHAVYAINGDYAGFRLNARYAGKDITLDNMDNFLYCGNQNFTVTLPSSPKTHQFYILTTVDNITVTVSSPITIKCGSGRFTSFDFYHGQTAILSYSGSYWVLVKIAPF